MLVDAPSITGVRASRLGSQLAGALTGSLADGGAVTKILNYYAAPGSSIDAEDDLFKAAGRARRVGW